MAALWGQLEIQHIAARTVFGDEWTGGSINWLLDVIAPDRGAAAAVIANFKQVAKEGELRLHPLVPRLIDKEALERMGATKMGDGG